MISPSSVTSIAWAAGTLGNPGIVITFPVITTINSAPADTLTSRTYISKSQGRPSFWGHPRENIEFCNTNR